MAVEDAIPDFQQVSGEVLAKAVDSIAASFIMKHFKGFVTIKLILFYC